MGRLATYIAGRASSADKLPGQLPNVSLIDVLFPRIISGSPSPRRSKVSLVDSVTGQPLPDKSPERGNVNYTDVTKDKKGRLVLVQHRDKSVGAGSGGGEGQATFQDVKKDVSAALGNKANEKKDAAVDENEFKFTPEEDATINKLKADNPIMQWAVIGEKLSRPAPEVKARHGELKKLAKGPSGDAKGASKQNDHKQSASKQENYNQNASKQTNTKKGSGGDTNPGEGDWTAAEDAIIRESKGEKSGKVAAKLAGRTRNEVGKRIHELHVQDEAKTKGDGATKENSDTQAKGGVGKKEKTNQDKSKQGETSNKDDSKQKGPSSKAGSKAGSKAASRAGSSRSEAKFTMGEWMTLQEDDMFSFRELQLLSELIMRDAKESRDGVYSWLRVASLFADRTGRRVHPEDIREKFEAMARD